MVQRQSEIAQEARQNHAITPKAPPHRFSLSRPVRRGFCIHGKTISEHDRPETDKNDKDISDYEIYKVILQIVNNPSSKKRILSKDEWSLLRDAVNEVSPDFDKKLSELCKMSEKDYHLCLLLKTGIPLSDIKKIVALSSSGVNSARNKLYIRAFGEKKHPEEWDKIIRSL